MNGNKEYKKQIANMCEIEEYLNERLKDKYLQVFKKYCEVWNYKIIENITELNKILENMDNKDNNQHLYYAGYTSLFLNIDEYGNEDEYRTDMS